MNHSESISKIAPAMVKFNQQVGRIEKDASNPFLKNKYASLDQIIDAVRPILAELGMFLSQSTGTGEDGSVTVKTRLTHESGEWMESDPLTMKPTKQNDPQQVGSVITYARRYSLTSFLSLNTGEDDDGNSSSGVNGPRNQSKPPHGKTQAKPTAKPENKPTTKKEAPDMTEVKRITLETAMKKGLTKDEAVKLLKGYATNQDAGVTVEECRQAVKDIKAYSLADLKLTADASGFDATQ